ncbi:prepilin-type N-terminal cleavage/methylation domain-containing protein [Pontiellaceae bacterium B12219]|nr:prepilin-type N-terminal cleavage/methylation domain-containing protein [Pontiellaceae bacterium B12219]
MEKKMVGNDKRQGFTLVEIMIVVAIIGLLVAIGLPSFQQARTSSLKKIAINNTRQVISAASQHNLSSGYGETNAVEISDLTDYFKGGIASMKIGQVSINDTVTVSGTETAEALAQTLYAGFF